MSRWFSIDPAMLNDFDVQRLKPEEFRAKFEAALAGENNQFSPFIRGPYSRPLANEWAAIRLSIFMRDDFTCTYCGARGVPLECDHVVPVAKGGTHDPDNLTTACRPCNRSKRAKLIEEWKP